EPVPCSISGRPNPPVRPSRMAVTLSHTARLHLRPTPLRVTPATVEKPRGQALFRGEMDMQVTGQDRSRHDAVFPLEITTGSGQAPGERPVHSLRPAVMEHVAAHAGGGIQPFPIRRLRGRSAGAVADALQPRPHDGP